MELFLKWVYSGKILLPSEKSSHCRKICFVEKDAITWFSELVMVSLEKYGNSAFSLKWNLKWNRTQNWNVYQKYAIIKKSTIFTRFLWDLVKMTDSSGGNFDQASKKLRILNNSIFLGHMSILGPHTVFIDKPCFLQRHWKTHFY